MKIIYILLYFLSSILVMGQDQSDKKMEKIVFIEKDGASCAYQYICDINIECFVMMGSKKVRYMDVLDSVSSVDSEQGEKCLAVFYWGVPHSKNLSESKFKIANVVVSKTLFSDMLNK